MIDEHADEPGAVTLWFGDYKGYRLDKLGDSARIILLYRHISWHGVVDVSGHSIHRSDVLAQKPDMAL